MTDRKPNILFMLNDHQAYYRHGWDGGVGPARPHFDRLAREGVNFERAYSVCPLCTPARRSMLTGLLPHNHGFITLDENENTQERDQGLLYPLLAEQGYQLFGYGKWHAGPGTAHDYGCEGYSYPKFGNPYVTPEYKAYVKARGMEPATFNVEHVFWEPVSPDEAQPGPGYRCDVHSLHPHVTGLLETPPDTHESFFLANLACEKLRELTKQEGDQPFFLRVDFYGPHAPYFASPEYFEMYDPSQILEYGSFRDDLSGKPGVYRKELNEPLGRDGVLLHPNPLPWSEWQRIMAYVYAQITQVDAAGGMILDELDRLGLADNTLVIWTTDHGDPIASHGGHYGKEAFLSEEVIRIPFAMRWPGHISPTQTSQHLISLMDLPVTLLDAAGTSFNGAVDGRSLLDLALEERAEGGAESWREDLVCQTHGHHGEQVVGRALLTGQYRYAVYKHLDANDREEELYDLQADPYQLNNLVNNRKYQRVSAELDQQLEAWRKQTGDTAPIR